MANGVAHRVSQGVAAWRAASLTPLATPLFKWLWLASIASNLGTVMQMTGAAWLMTELDASPHMVALVQTAALLPIVMLALPAGALADIANRRALMLTSQSLGLVSALLLVGLTATGWMTPWALLGCTALVGVANALHTPAWQASFADFVPRNDLPAAIGLNSLSFNVARSVGPALGGMLIAAAGALVTFAVNAVSYLAMIGVLWRNRLPRAASGLPPEPIGQAMFAGLRYASMSRALRTVFLRSALFGFGGAAISALAPLIAQERLSGGAVTYGLLLGGFGAGSLAAAALTAYVRGRLGNERVFAVSTTAFALATFAAGYLTIAPLTFICMLICGACWIFAFATTTTCIQLSSPRWVVGRAVALSQIAAVGSVALGAAVWGYIAEHLSLTAAFSAAATFMATTLVFSRLAALPGLDFEDLSPQPVDLPPPSSLQASAGPIIVTIEYRAPRGRLDEFLAVLYALGAIRKRDGARRWSLQQDVDRPEIWVECIESATWADHLRRAQRGTVADRAIRARAEAFRVNGAASVRRLIERPRGAAPLT